MPFKDPVSIDDARETLRAKSILICPDTCILLHMVKREKNHTYIKHIDLWLLQMNKCATLLADAKVGWVIPEQIMREFDKNSESQSSVIDKLEEELTKDEAISDDYIYNLNNLLKQQITEVKDKAEQNRRTIIENSCVLKEYKGDFIHHAWELVYKDSFPNKKEQQMKDSTILSHLHSFANFLKKSYIQPQIYFWTFDEFNSSGGIKQFPDTAAETHIKILKDISDINHTTKPATLSL